LVVFTPAVTVTRLPTYFLQWGHAIRGVEKARRLRPRTLSYQPSMGPRHQLSYQESLEVSRVSDSRGIRADQGIQRIERPDPERVAGPDTLFLTTAVLNQHVTESTAVSGGPFRPEDPRRRGDDEGFAEDRGQRRKLDVPRGRQFFLELSNCTKGPDERRVELDSFPGAEGILIDFNGAATMASRKRLGMRISSIFASATSMGPRRWRRGKSPRSLQRSDMPEGYNLGTQPTID
jgi:hypothetical protein